MSAPYPDGLPGIARLQPNIAMRFGAAVRENPQASYYRARYYHPQLQRFVSEDPIGIRGGMNRYAYVSNSPANFFDPLGLNKKDPFDRAKDLARCAGSISQAGSLNAITGQNIPIVGGNVFGDLSSLVAGPEPGTDPAQAGLERVDQGAAVGLELVAEPVLTPVLTNVAGQAATGTFTSLSMPVSYASGVYNPISVATTAGGETVAGGLLEIFSGIAEAKLAYDALIFGLSVGVCAFTQ